MANDNPNFSTDADIHESAYDASSGDDNFAYVPKGDPPSARKFKIGDAQHVKLAVSAFVNWSFRGNEPDIPDSAKPGIKRKIAGAIHKHLNGDEAKYYSKWLSTGKKPDEKSSSEMVHEMISFDAPFFTFADEHLYPEVTVFPDIDLTALTAGDPDPLFVTRPLAVLEGVSEHGLVYDERLLNLLMSQVQAKRPVARQGHVPEDERDSLFPDDVAIWIGVLRDGSYLYAKAYILPRTHFNTMVRARKAAGTELKTSIWGQGAYVNNGDGTVRCVDLDLESIDFVPAERAALQALPGQFETTSEMKGDRTMAEQHADAAADLELLKKSIASIKPEDVYEMLKGPNHAQYAEMFVKNTKPAEMYEMMPHEMRTHVAKSHIGEASAQEVYEMMSESTRRHVAETHAAASGLKMVPQDAGLVTSGTVAEMNGMKTTISEMQAALANYQRADFDRAINAEVDGKFSDWNVTTEAGKTKLAAAKANYRIQLVAEMAGSTKAEDIAPAGARAWETFKPLAEMTRASIAGPNAAVGTTSFAGAGEGRFGFDRNSGRYSDEAMARARAATNTVDTTRRGV